MKLNKYFIISKITKYFMEYKLNVLCFPTQISVPIQTMHFEIDAVYDILNGANFVLNI